MRLDGPTLLVEIFLFEVFLALVMLLYSRHRKVYPGFDLWTGAAFSVGTAYLAILVRPAWLPPPVSVFLTLGSTVLAATLRLDGLLRFVGRAGLAGRWYLVPPLAAAALSFVPDVVVRTGVVSLLVAGYMMLCIPVLLSVSHAGRHLNVTAACIMVAQGVGMLGRAAAWYQNPIPASLDAIPAHSAFFGLMAVGEVGLVCVFLLMNSFRLELDLADSTRRLSQALEELQGSMASLKVLRGFLSICMHCKKVRVRGEEWEQIEVYVDRHSDARFSHGFCPQCLQAQRERCAPGGLSSPPAVAEA